MKKLVLMAAVALPILALAESAQIPVDSGTFLDAIAHFLNAIPAVTIAGVLATLEIILRVIPSSVPLSLLVPVKKVLDMVVFIVQVLNGLIEQVIVVANKVKK